MMGGAPTHFCDLENYLNLEEWNDDDGELAIEPDALLRVFFHLAL